MRASGVDPPTAPTAAHPPSPQSSHTTEINMYAVCQKEELGFDKAVEECKYRE